MSHLVIPRIAIELIKHYEGFSPKVYMCAAGYPTIGYGHVVQPGEEKLFKDGITREQGEEILMKDLTRFTAGIWRLTKVPLNEAQFSALLSFVFNLGLGAYQRSTLRSKLNREEYDDVDEEFDKWVYGGGRKLAGLVKRRESESILFETGKLVLV